MKKLSIIIVTLLALTGCINGEYEVIIPPLPCAGGYQLDRDGQFITDPNTGAAIPCESK